MGSGPADEANTECAGKMESSTGICTRKSAGWRSVENMESTMGRYDKKSAKGNCVIQNMNTEHAIEMESSEGTCNKKSAG